MTDVAIIGAGPVGLALAHCLGLKGLRVRVLEREAEGHALPRAVMFDDEIMRLFQNLGLAEEVGAISEVGSDAQFVDGEGRVLVHWERPMVPTENGWYVNNRFHQPTLERVLREGLARYPKVRIDWRHEVTGLEQDEDGVLVSANTPEGRAFLRAGYVVGCDGGRSFTRDWIGGGSRDLGFHEQWLIADLKLPAPERDPDRRTTHYCGTPRMGSKVFVGSARKRWEFRLNPDDDPATIGSPEATWAILKEWITPEEATLERTAVYTFHSTIARTWRRGRVFIAGDAAHQTPPFMGQGMCAGLRDAANLGWKLARVVEGRSPPGLLDSYQSERVPHVGAFIELTMNLGRVINATARAVTTGNIAAAQEGAQRMRLIRPALGPGLSAGDTGLSGTLFPQPVLVDGERLDEGRGYRCFVVRTGLFDPAVEEAFLDAGIELFDPGQPELDAWLAERGLAAALVRPDRAILGTVDDPARARELLPANWRLSAT